MQGVFGVPCLGRLKKNVFFYASLLIALLSWSSFKDLHMAEISCLLGRKWRSLSPAEKLPYKKGSISF